MSNLHYNVVEKEEVILATVSEGAGLSLIVHKDGDARVFNRKAIKKPFKGGEEVRESCLVGELNGVRVYIKDSIIVLTTQDIYL